MGERACGPAGQAIDWELEGVGGANGAGDVSGPFQVLPSSSSVGPEPASNFLAEKESPMSEAALSPVGSLTYEDLKAFPEDERWELIDGVPYAMSPAPLVRHQDIVSNFHIALKTNPANPCYTGLAPTDVVLSDENAVQPDVFLLCDRDRLKPGFVDGAPDLVVEVLSPSSEVRDRREKLRLYEKFGVREYVVVFPEREYVERYLLTDGRYALPEIFTWEETLRLAVVDVEISLWEIFEKAPPGPKETETGATGKFESDR
jgi:Uma2 family endonuclease